MDKLPHYCPICAYHEWNLDGLVEMIWEYLDLVRVYTKPKGKLPDFNEPVVLRRSQCSVEGFCNKLHKTMVKQVRSVHRCGRGRAVGAAAVLLLRSAWFGVLGPGLTHDNHSLARPPPPPHTRLTPAAQVCAGLGPERQAPAPKGGQGPHFAGRGYRADREARVVVGVQQSRRGDERVRGPGPGGAGRCMQLRACCMHAGGLCCWRALSPAHLKPALRQPCVVLCMCATGVL